MNELLRKYYEFYKKNSNNEHSFNDFYGLIINAKDMSNNKQFTNDIKVFFKMYDKIGFLGNREASIYSPHTIGEKASKLLFQKENTSYDYFTPSKNMIRNRSFVFSFHNSKEVFCKTYLSIKPERYLEVIIKLQNYFDEFFQNHKDEDIAQWKFRNIPSNDAIVMRFAKKEHYNEFCDYLENHKEIKEAFDTPNIFLPRDKNGVSIISDKGGSYNSFITKIIWEYLKKCEQLNKDTNIYDLVSFINSYNYYLDKDININEEIIQDYKLVLTAKLLGETDEKILSAIFKQKERII